LVVAAATVAVIFQYTSRGGDIRLYILTGWALFVAWLIGYSELRLGRKQLRRGQDAMFLGLAAFVGEEKTDHTGERQRVWTGTAAGALAFEPQGIRWVPRNREDNVEEISFPWSDLYTWRLTGVVPFVWRASGYLLLSLYGGRELVFHIHGIRVWQRAVREASIVGPTLLSPERASDVFFSDDDRAPTPAGTPAEPVVLQAAPVSPEDQAPEVTVPPLPFGEPAPLEPVAAEPPAQAFEAVIGLECHVELSTASKMFCSCPVTFGGEPNTSVCPVCSGQPGTLPVPNARAIEYALRIALALNCRVTPESIFHRKNYFYPDMPKNYQISQYDIPLATDGFIEIEVDSEDGSTAPGLRRIGIERVHIEEDTGKIVHAGEGGRIGVADYALIDYNRAGIPLVEIVSKPDITSPDEARAYVTELRGMLLALGVSDVRMEEGSLRVDANVSVRPRGATELGVKTEVKNVNSIRSVNRALAHEIDRQTELLAAGREIVQETRHFDENTGRTIGGRLKEYSSDYRYFPDPDLVPLAPSTALIEDIRTALPELPTHRRHRLVVRHGLSAVDVRSLTATPGLADAFEAAAAAYQGNGQAIARWYLGEIAQLAHERNVQPHEVLRPEAVAQLQTLVDEERITISLAKGEVLRRVVETGRTPAEVVEEAGLAQISDPGDLGGIVDEVLAANPAIVEQVRGGKTGAINALLGQVMKQTRGQANAQVVRQLLEERVSATA
jgi:aspartyl-tRNA(Asn)/glutamyl-tRNA(Gln) amidotransferase subunit B